VQKARARFESFDVETARCAKEEDTQRLLACIELGFGSYAPFNKLIRETFGERLQEPPLSIRSPHPSIARVLVPSRTRRSSIARALIPLGLARRRRTSIASAPMPSGLKWEGAGTEKPTDGKELTNEKLAEGLKSKTEFTKEEWKEFGIQELDAGHYIKSGDEYFKPAAMPQRAGRKTQARAQQQTGST